MSNDLQKVVLCFKKLQVFKIDLINVGFSVFTSRLKIV
jgi:hypothetical protein